MNPFEMVVLIILIVTIGRVVSGRMNNRRDRERLRAFDRGEGTGDGASAAEEARLRSEVTRLNERIQVLERLATDPGKRLSDEIEALKNSK
ncbi:hypothetical protein [Polymorphobacter fuscus]|uniref:Envelope stress response membrane protein PspB n=1 Tax=Sandarakinorhabdus fusca TaxID=1439888 RepID=A0A7C9LG37_9SPHN|nr:hypothetical protein [Polymorphobacter fuscus]KAB7647860.1 hypothetical protein F9290_07815 [Polymorphobacter fuscus]MQT17167.1 hypothetical protein [Polymorphobacter fuscus]NJC08839.1 hypothetical protein [Polymorphobacter fuscus]